MAAKPSMHDFQFIVSTGPQIPADPEVRTIIRKQAMKDVTALRKKRGDYGPINPMQYRIRDSSTGFSKGTVGYSLGVTRELTSLASGASSISMSPCTTTSATEMTASIGVVRFGRSTASLTSVEQYETRLPIPAPNPTDRYEALRVKLNFDVMDLSHLTSFHIGQSTMSAMARNPDLLTTLIGCEVNSYLSFVPSRYGHKPYLTAVIDCVTTKARSTLCPSDTGLSTTATNTYGKALHAVQEAVMEEGASQDADLLCAVQMLSFYEILEPERTSAYAHHIEGSARLIRHRSPSSFTTSYEQMLFLAHVGPAFSEAFYRGEPCYLAQPKWIKLYESLAEETPSLTERSPLVIRIRKALLHSSGMFVDTSWALSAEGQHNAGFLLTLELKIRAIHQDLLNCLKEYEAHVIHAALTSPLKLVPVGILGTVLQCLCVYKRMLAALCEADRTRLEDECQALAELLLQRHKHPSAIHSWTNADLEHGIALILQKTRTSWQEDLTDQTAAQQRLASRKRWENFRGCTTEYFHAASNDVSARSGRPRTTFSACL